jgi:anti-sigma regulatory factor (Ser/Thr protein kinase)
MPLAAARDVAYREGRARIAPGGMVLLYSDGLVERRRESIDVGLGRLEALGAGAAGAPAEEVCDRLLRGLLDDGRPADDVALLVLRRTGAPAAAFSRRVPARATELASLRRELRSWLRSWGLEAELVGDLTLACGEALANAVEHAYGADEAGDVELRGTLVPDGELRVAVRDFGRWRAPVQRPERGRGLPIMRTLADDVRMTIDEGGTEVVLVRRIEPRT